MEQNSEKNSKKLLVNKSTFKVSNVSSVLNADFFQSTAVFSSADPTLQNFQLRYSNSQTILTIALVFFWNGRDEFVALFLILKPKLASLLTTFFSG